LTSQKIKLKDMEIPQGNSREGVKLRNQIKKMPPAQHQLRLLRSGRVDPSQKEKPTQK
jgi:hypothetical protein